MNAKTTITKQIKRDLSAKNIISTAKIDDKNTYLKFCWMCGSAFTSFRSDALGCSDTCARTIRYKLINKISLPVDADRARDIDDDTLESFGFKK